MASLLNQGAYVLVPFWQSAYGLSQASAALPVSVMSAGQILLMVPLGLAMDRQGERRVVALTMVGMGMAAFSLALFAANSYLMLLLLMLVLGAFSGAVQPGGTRAIVRWFPQSLRGMTTGVRQAGLPLGTALAAVTLPTLAITFGWTMAVAVAGTCVIAGGVLFGVFYREGGQPVQGSAPRGIGELIAKLATIPALRPVLVAGVVMVSFQYTFFTHVLTFLTSLEVPIVAAGLFFALAQALGIAGRVVLPYLSDYLWPGRRMRSLKGAMYGCALAVVALMLLPPLASSWLVAAIFALLGLFGIGWYPLWLVEVAEMAPSTAVTSTISFAMTLNLIGITVAPPLFGLAVDLWNYQAAWTLVAVMLGLAAMQLRQPATSSGG